MRIIAFAPLLAGLLAKMIARLASMKNLEEGALADVQVFKYPRRPTGIIFFLSVVIPALIFFFPDSLVKDARPLFDLFSLFVAAIFLFAWAYFYWYEIRVDREFIVYGAFKKKDIKLTAITYIKYHWVNNGVSLKLYSGDRLLAVFEGGLSNFDALAQCIKRRATGCVKSEVVGKARFD